MAFIVKWILLVGAVSCQAQRLFTSKYEIWFVNNQEKDFAAASTSCSNGNLLKVENKYITDILRPHITTKTWIGASDKDEEGTWLWRDGTQATRGHAAYSYWNEHEPNGDGGQNCAVVGFVWAPSVNKAEWVDVACTESHIYICQRGAKRVYTPNFEFTLYKLKRTFEQAKTTCYNRGKARLAKVDDPSISVALAAHINDGGEASTIGITDSVTEGTWVWTDGTVTTYTNWNQSPKEPNGGSGQNCVYINKNGKWVDYSCGDSVPFICQRDLPIHITQGDKVFTFYGSFSGGDDKTYQDAKTACESNDAKLAEVLSQGLNDALTVEITISEGEFWTGGKREASGDWKWNGEEAFNYTHWKESYPVGDSAKDCMAIDAVGWKNEDCSGQKHYICEQARVNNLVVTAESVSLVKAGAYHVTCSASGLPIPDVRWERKPHTPVSTSQESTVYQTQGSGYSTLILTHANLADSGDYICIASNEPRSGKEELNKTIAVSVSGSPNVTSILPQSCNSSLFVEWTPSSRAVGFLHKVTALTPKDQEVKVVQVTPDAAVSQNTEVEGLDNSTRYTIKITACKSSECLVTFEDTMETVTGGIPKEVRSPTMTQNVTTGCLIQWKPPSKTPESVINYYEVIIKSTVVQYRGNRTGPFVETDKVSNTVNQQAIELSPNRNYSAVIQAVSCAGGSGAVDVVGSCVTESGAPSTIPPPEVSEANDEDFSTRSVSFILPKETNGLISCLFVIVEVGDSFLRNDSFNLGTLDQLTLLNTDGSAYLAIAVVYSSLLNGEPIHTFIIGDGETSACDPRKMSSSVKRKRRSANGTSGGTYEARNSPLRSDEKYSVSLVSATPTAEGNVVFKQSPRVAFETTKKGSDPWIIPLVVILAILFAILLGAVVFVWIKRRKQEEPKERLKLEASSLNPIHTDQVPAEKTYENVAMKQTKTSTKIQVSDFLRIYNEMRKNNNEKFLEEFKVLVQTAAEDTSSKEFASNPDLKKKNRYKNILPYDHSRVVIQGNDTGYINACFIDGFQEKHKFIASQGPLPGTVSDFWLMVVEQECGVIVMLTREVEVGKRKCEKYWPDNGTTAEYGSITVETREEVNFSSYVRRTFHVKLAEEIYENALIITQYQFLKWPDHGVPPTTSNLLRMHRVIMETQAQERESPPIIVHCSAGAGRTGTFIGYDILVEEYQKTGKADVFQCVLNMRKQRVEMVQNCDQYILLHKFVVESYLFGDTNMQAHDVQTKLSDSETLAKEFANLSKIGPMKDSMATGQAEMNADLNKDTKIIPYDYNLVTINPRPDETTAPYLNASWIETYDSSASIIAAQGPMDVTAEYFWRAVTDNNVKTIVMLGDVADDTKGFQYWPSNVGDSEKYGKVQVTLSQAEEDKKIIERTLMVNNELTEKKAELKHYQYADWSPRSCPEYGSGIIDLINKMQENMRNHGGATLVHCSDGAGRTGAFCAIVNLIERLKVENEVDVFRTVKDLRDRRAGMAQSLMQYTFCHKAIEDYLKSFELYSNF